MGEGRSTVAGLVAGQALAPESTPQGCKTVLQRGVRVHPQAVGSWPEPSWTALEAPRPDAQEDYGQDGRDPNASHQSVGRGDQRCDWPEHDPNCQPEGLPPVGLPRGDEALHGAAAAAHDGPVRNRRPTVRTGPDPIPKRPATHSVGSFACGVPAAGPTRASSFAAPLIGRGSPARLGVHVAGPWKSGRSVPSAPGAIVPSLPSMAAAHAGSRAGGGDGPRPTLGRAHQAAEPARAPAFSRPPGPR